MPQFNDYLLAVGQSAGQYQYLEEMLKMYLAACFKVVKNRVQDKIDFNYTYKDVAKKPLGELIEILKHYNSDEALHSILVKLTRARNHIAHKAYLLTSEEMRNSDTLEKEIKRLETIYQAVEKVLQHLVKEGQKIEELAVGKKGET
jgi:hypothetical protein